MTGHERPSGNNAVWPGRRGVMKLAMIALILAMAAELTSAAKRD